MKKILIGTHNKVNLKKLAIYYQKNQKNFTNKLKIKSPKETGKTFYANSKLKANYFSKFTNYQLFLMTQAYALKP